MDPTPCRFCTNKAYEAICLDCKRKVEDLKRENEYLKRQVAHFQASQRGREMRMTLKIKRKMKSKEK